MPDQEPEPEIGPLYDLLTGAPLPTEPPPAPPDPPPLPPPPFELPADLRPGWIPPGLGANSALATTPAA